MQDSGTLVFQENVFLQRVKGHPEVQDESLPKLRAFSRSGRDGIGPRRSGSSEIQSLKSMKSISLQKSFIFPFCKIYTNVEPTMRSIQF